MTEEKLNEYRDANTREIEMPDGSRRSVRMTPELWNSWEFVMEMEGLTEVQLAGFAQEEMELQEVPFDRALRGVVAYLANLWTA